MEYENENENGCGNGRGSKLECGILEYEYDRLMQYESYAVNRCSSGYVDFEKGEI